MSVVNRRGNIQPNRGGRGQPLGGGNRNDNDQKFKAFSGAGHSLQDK